MISIAAVLGLYLKPDILIKSICDFPQSLQVNSVIIPKMSHDHYTSSQESFTAILPSDTTVNRGSLNKPSCDLFVTDAPVISRTSIAMLQVVDIVLRLLEDDWLEVREKASQVLGGLLHCNFIESPDDLIVSVCVVHAAASVVAALCTSSDLSSVTSCPG
jgi:hypothetical protein